VFSVRLPKQPSGTEKEESTVVDLPGKKKEWYSIDPRSNGFTIRSVPKVPRPPVRNLRVTFAYDVSSGDPFRIWSRFDFELRHGTASTLKITGKGVNASLLGGNEVLLTDLQEAFSFSVEGFDAARDVVVRAEADAPVDGPEAVEA